jgi:hypothetical protein
MHATNACCREVSDFQHERPGVFFDTVVDLLDRGYAVRFRAPGRSMLPTIGEEEPIIVEPVTPEAVRRGDIILYSHGKTVTAHRVVGIDRHGREDEAVFTLRGDAARLCDEPVRSGQVLGRVIAVERDGRTIGMNGKTVGAFHRLCAAVSRLKWRVYHRINGGREVLDR